MKFIILFISVFLVSETNAQLLKKLENKAARKVNQRIDRKADKAIDKGLDKVEDGAEAGVTNSTKQTSRADNSANATAVSSEPAGGLTSYSKFDFVPGEKILFSEDFSMDATGEFPALWNTNGSGEVVTIKNVPGKWLMLNAGTKYITPIEKKFPDNYTVEFDLLVERNGPQRVPEIVFGLFKEGANQYYPSAKLSFFPGGGNNNNSNKSSVDRVRFHSATFAGKALVTGQDYLTNEFYKLNGSETPVHISVWVQKLRLRAWVNGIKVYDLPRALSPDAMPDRMRFEVGAYGGDRSKFNYYLSNVKVAEATPDTRSKLLTEGKWATTGIQFNVNSDKILPSSYAVLKDIAQLLKDNPEVKVKIIGHTDSDGDDKANMNLSTKRSAAVRSFLQDEFSIEPSRLQTGGKGESEPVSDNKSNEGKAKNRRVEFIKI